MILLVWHGIDALFNALLYTGLVVLPVGLVVLGTAMIGALGFGVRVGGTTVALGVVGLAAAVAVLAGVTDLAAVGVLVLVGFHVVVGRRMLTLANDAPRASATRGSPGNLGARA